MHLYAHLVIICLQVYRSFLTMPVFNYIRDIQHGYRSAGPAGRKINGRFITGICRGSGFVISGFTKIKNCNGPFRSYPIKSRNSPHARTNRPYAGNAKTEISLPQIGKNEFNNQPILCDPSFGQKAGLVNVGFLQESVKPNWPACIAGSGSITVYAFTGCQQPQNPPPVLVH